MDLSYGRQVAFESERRHRVVTIHGQLIEISGEMSGGFGTSRKGFIKLTGDIIADHTEDPKQLYLECKKLKKQLEELLRTKDQKENELEETKKYLSDGQSQFRSMEFQMNREEEELKIIKEKIQFDENKNKMLTKKLKGEEGFENKLKASKNELSSIEQEREDVEKKLSDIKFELVNIMGEKYKKLKKELEEIEEKKHVEESRMMKEKRRLVSAENKISNAKKFAGDIKVLIKDLESKIKDNEFQKEENLKFCNVLIDKQEEVRDEHVEILKKIREAEELLDDKNKNCEDDKREMAKIYKEIKTLKNATDEYLMKEEEFDKKILKIRSMYSDALKSYGDSGNNKILSQLEKTYNLFNNGNDTDIEEIIAQMESDLMEESEIKPDLTNLNISK
jgi:chromosome segregation ATPase